MEQRRQPDPAALRPLRWLKVLARFPHEHRTWLSGGHTLPNGDPPQPYARGTALCCALLLGSLSLAAEAQELTLPTGAPLRFWTLYPLHAEEMAFKLNHGTEALIDEFERARVGDVIDPRRPSAVKPPPRKKLFGLF